MSGYRVVPDIEAVASMNELYLSDLLTYATIVRYAGDSREEDHRNEDHPA